MTSQLSDDGALHSALNTISTIATIVFGVIATTVTLWHIPKSRDSKIRVMWIVAAIVGLALNICAVYISTVSPTSLGIISILFLMSAIPQIADRIFHPSITRLDRMVDQLHILQACATIFILSNCLLIGFVKVSNNCDMMTLEVIKEQKVTIQGLQKRVAELETNKSKGTNEAIPGKIK